MGVSHIYVEPSADFARSVPVIVNAKVQRPGACNALDTLLVHRNAAPAFLPMVAAALAQHGVEMRCDLEALAILSDAPGHEAWNIKPAEPADFGREFLALIVAIKVVSDIDEALDHIAQYGGHSEAILTGDPASAARFTREVDATAVFVNASTRFNDGGQFGLGAEVAISTNRLHARGPMGLQELTTYTWIGEGDYLVRA